MKVNFEKKKNIEKIINYFEKSKQIIIDSQTNELYEKILNISEIIINTIEANGMILVCGNGGSASDCSHIFSELMGKFYHIRKPVKIVDLTSNSSFLTAWSNDVEFNFVFSRQLEAFNDSKNILIAISTSGESKNILNALQTAKKYKIKTIALTGGAKGKMLDYSDLSLEVPSKNTPIIQQVHLIIYHIICALIEERLLDE